MNKVLVTLKNINDLPHRPFALQGMSGIVYGHANFDAKAAGHIITLDFEQLKKIGVDLVKAFDRPLSKWTVHNVEVLTDEGDVSKLATALDEAQSTIAELQAQVKELMQREIETAKALERNEEFQKKWDSLERTHRDSVRKDSDGKFWSWACRPTSRPELDWKEVTHLCDAPNSKRSAGWFEYKLIPTTEPAPINEDMDPAFGEVVRKDATFEDVTKALYGDAPPTKYWDLSPVDSTGDAPIADRTEMLEELSAAMDPAQATVTPLVERDPDGNPYTHNPDSEAEKPSASRREEIEAISNNFRVLRKQAIEAGVTVPKEAKTTAQVVDAWLAHEAALAPANS